MLQLDILVLSCNSESSSLNDAEKFALEREVGCVSRLVILKVSSLRIKVEEYLNRITTLSARVEKLKNDKHCSGQKVTLLTRCNVIKDTKLTLQPEEG
jgi:hypothetical protein